MSVIVTPNNHPTRPQLALRVGVAGARHLDAKQVERLQNKLRTVLEQARTDMRLVAQEQDVTAAYDHADRHAPEPVLSILSPLARGADRLGAEITLNLGYTLG